MYSIHDANKNQNKKLILYIANLNRYYNEQPDTYL